MYITYFLLYDGDVTMTIEPPLASGQEPLDEEQAAIRAAWAETIAQRLDDMDSGLLHTSNPWDTLAIMRDRASVWPE